MKFILEAIIITVWVALVYIIINVAVLASHSQFGIFLLAVCYVMWKLLNHQLKSD